MKNIFTIVLIALSFAVSVHAEKWYEGGTLHSATVKEWKEATHRNKIATSGDWILSVSKSVKSKVMRSGNIDILIPYCRELVICIDGSVKDQTFWDNTRVTSLSTLCMMLMGWLPKE